MSNCDDNLKPSSPSTSTSGIKNNKPGSSGRLPTAPETVRQSKITKGQATQVGGVTAANTVTDATTQQGSNQSVGAGGAGSGGGTGSSGQPTQKGGVTGSSEQAQATAQIAKTKEEIEKEKQKSEEKAQKESEKQWSQPETEHGRVDGEEIEGKDLYPNKEKKSKEFKPISIYPFNKTFQTESGHVLEMDDTPGSERLSVFHRSGSNIEFYPNGDVVEQHVRDSYFHVFRDQYVHLGGYSTVSIDKGLKVLINHDEDKNTKEENVNFDIHVSGNANVNIYIHKGNMNVSLVEGDANIRLNKGDVNLRQDEGNFNHTVGGDYNLEVGGHMHVVVGGNVVNEIGGSRDERIDGDFDQKYLTNSSGYLGEYLLGDKRTYVGGDLITEVINDVTETGRYKKEQYVSKEQKIEEYILQVSKTNQIVSNELQIETKIGTTIKSGNNLDIFGANSGLGTLRIYSGNRAEFVAEKYGVLRSASDIIEIKTPKRVSIRSPKLKTPDPESSEGYTPDPKPQNLINPSKYQIGELDRNDDFMKNNKKEWTPTSAKNS